MKKNFRVELTEFLTQIIEVEANSKEEAEQKVFEKYVFSEIKLADRDYSRVPKIRALENEDI